MPDYKEMYLTLFRATEEALRVLIDAQRACEELYLSAPAPELIVFPGGRSRPGRKKIFSPSLCTEPCNHPPPRPY